MPDIDLLSLVGLSLGGLSLFRFFPLFRADVTLFEVLGALRGDPRGSRQSIFSPKRVREQGLLWQRPPQPQGMEGGYCIAGRWSYL